MQSLRNSLEDYINKNKLKEKKIGLACSGGVDSMVLLDLLVQLISKKNLYIYHCNHSWHNRSHDIKVALKNFAENLGINFHSIDLDFSKLKKTEDQARKLRLDYFLERSASLNIEDLFMAHHLDDNAETILFRIIRGTAISGLAGIKEQNTFISQKSENDENAEIGVPLHAHHQSLKIHRPLLSFTKAEIEEYANFKNTEYWEDPSNKSDIYARNRIRLNIFPEAEKINPKFKSNIQNLSNLIIEQENFIETITKNTIDDLGELPWSLEKFKTIHKAIQRRILAIFFTKNISFQNDFLAAIEIGGFHRINFEKEKFFTIKQKKIFLENLL